MTALYLAHLDAPDMVSVKPHASPVFHAIQYLLGNLDRGYLPTLRAFGGLRCLPSASGCTRSASPARSPTCTVRTIWTQDPSSTPPSPHYRYAEPAASPRGGRSWSWRSLAREAP